MIKTAEGRFVLTHTLHHIRDGGEARGGADFSRDIHQEAKSMAGTRKWPTSLSVFTPQRLARLQNNTVSCWMNEQHSILARLVPVTPELGNLKKKDYYDLDVSLGYVV